ncbi:DUF2867 domain-containing protein [Pseudonocardia sp.]|uniref:DUF2867 domain-containing protein n=1 Tax=Pseudonocardia sp. TaxID=60912 RepID=UPI003D110289
MVYDVRERIVEAPVEVVGPLLDRLGGPDDVLWPSPAWAPLELDGPLAVGVRGGHGGLRYRVHEHVPGRRVGFTFEPGAGVDGTHTLSADPLDARRTLLRHEARGRLRGTMRLAWPLGVRTAHRAVLEDLFDRAADAAGAPPARPARWSPYARLLQGLEWPSALAVTPPATALLTDALPRVDWTDAYAVERHPGTPDDPRTWMDAALHRPPAWVLALLAVRALAARVSGVGPSADDFRIAATTADEVLLASQDAHQAVRISILVQPRRVVLTTAVALTSARGRLFSALVRRLHPLAVRGLLRGAAGRLSRARRTAPAGG